ncbi:MAG: hypothetical protein MHM6MM_001979 [Cercozoa sp. M6MM]
MEHVQAQLRDAQHTGDPEKAVRSVNAAREAIRAAVSGSVDQGQVGGVLHELACVLDDLPQLRLEATHGQASSQAAHAGELEALQVASAEQLAKGEHYCVRRLQRIDALLSHDTACSDLCDLLTPKTWTEESVASMSGAVAVLHVVHRRVRRKVLLSRLLLPLARLLASLCLAQESALRLIEQLSVLRVAWQRGTEVLRVCLLAAEHERSQRRSSEDYGALLLPLLRTVDDTVADLPSLMHAWTRLETALTRRLLQCDSVTLRASALALLADALALVRRYDRFRLARALAENVRQRVRDLMLRRAHAQMHAHVREVFAFMAKERADASDIRALWTACVAADAEADARRPLLAEALRSKAYDPLSIASFLTQSKVMELPRSANSARLLCTVARALLQRGDPSVPRGTEQIINRVATWSLQWPNDGDDGPRACASLLRELPRLLPETSLLPLLRTCLRPWLPSLFQRPSHLKLLTQVLESLRARDLNDGESHGHSRVATLLKSLVPPSTVTSSVASSVASSVPPPVSPSVTAGSPSASATAVSSAGSAWGTGRPKSAAWLRAHCVASLTRHAASLHRFLDLDGDAVDAKMRQEAQTQGESVQRLVSLHLRLLRQHSSLPLSDNDACQLLHAAAQLLCAPEFLSSAVSVRSAILDFLSDEYAQAHAAVQVPVQPAADGADSSCLSRVACEALEVLMLAVDVQSPNDPAIEDMKAAFLDEAAWRLFQRCFITRNRLDNTLRVQHQRLQLVVLDEGDGAATVPTGWDKLLAVAVTCDTDGVARAASDLVARLVRQSPLRAFSATGGRDALVVSLLRSLQALLGDVVAAGQLHRPEQRRLATRAAALLRHVVLARVPSLRQHMTTQGFQRWRLWSHESARLCESPLAESSARTLPGHLSFATAAVMPDEMADPCLRELVSSNLSLPRSATVADLRASAARYLGVPPDSVRLAIRAADCAADAYDQPVSLTTSATGDDSPVGTTGTWRPVEGSECLPLAMFLRAPVPSEAHVLVWPVHECDTADESESAETQLLAKTPPELWLPEDLAPPVTPSFVAWKSLLSPQEQQLLFTWTAPLAWLSPDLAELALVLQYREGAPALTTSEDTASQSSTDDAVGQYTVQMDGETVRMYDLEDSSSQEDECSDASAESSEWDDGAYFSDTESDALSEAASSDDDDDWPQGRLGAEWPRLQDDAVDVSALTPLLSAWSDAPLHLALALERLLLRRLHARQLRHLALRRRRGKRRGRSPAYARPSSGGGVVTRAQRRRASASLALLAAVAVPFAQSLRQRVAAADGDLAAVTALVNDGDCSRARGLHQLLAVAQALRALAQDAVRVTVTTSGISGGISSGITTGGTTGTESQQQHRLLLPSSDLPTLDELLRTVFRMALAVVDLGGQDGAAVDEVIYRTGMATVVRCGASLLLARAAPWQPEEQAQGGKKQTQLLADVAGDYARLLAALLHDETRAALQHSALLSLRTLARVKSRGASGMHHALVETLASYLTTADDTEDDEAFDGQDTIFEALSAFLPLLSALPRCVRPELLGGDNALNCEQCGVKRDTTRRSSMLELPDTLLITLKRFDFDLHTLRRRKIQQRFPFPHALDMAEFAFGSSARGAARAQLDGLVQYERGDYEYECVGVVVHKGGADSGHYFSLLRARAPGPLEDGDVDVFQGTQEERYDWSKARGQWFEFNDRDVRPLPSAALVPRLSFGGGGDGGDQSQSAYVLVYQRRRPRSSLLPLHVPSDSAHVPSGSDHVPSDHVSTGTAHVSTGHTDRLVLAPHLRDEWRRIRADNDSLVQRAKLGNLEMANFVAAMAERIRRRVAQETQEKGTHQRTQQGTQQGTHQGTQRTGLSAGLVHAFGTWFDLFVRVTVRYGGTDRTGTDRRVQDGVTGTDRRVQDGVTGTDRTDGDTCQAMCRLAEHVVGVSSQAARLVLRRLLESADGLDLDKTSDPATLLTQMVVEAPRESVRRFFASLVVRCSVRADGSLDRRRCLRTCATVLRRQFLQRHLRSLAPLDGVHRVQCATQLLDTIGQLLDSEDDGPVARDVATQVLATLQDILMELRRIAPHAALAAATSARACPSLRVGLTPVVRLLRQRSVAAVVADLDATAALRLATALATAPVLSAADFDASTQRDLVNDAVTLALDSGRLDDLVREVCRHLLLQADFDGAVPLLAVLYRAATVRVSVAVDIVCALVEAALPTSNLVSHRLRLVLLQCISSVVQLRDVAASLPPATVTALSSLLDWLTAALQGQPKSSAEPPAPPGSQELRHAPPPGVSSDLRRRFLRKRTQRAARYLSNWLSDARGAFRGVGASDSNTDTGKGVARIGRRWDSVRKSLANARRNAIASV